MTGLPVRPFARDQESDDVVQFMDRVTGGDLAGFFDADRPLVVTRAPGRLDVMGGIADYSGSLVLQMPIAEATLVAAQTTVEPGVRVVSRPVLLGGNRRSRNEDPASGATRPREAYLTLPQLDALANGSPDDAHAFFQEAPGRRWCSYVVGTLLMLARERGLLLDQGLRLLIQSHVPEAKGVSSSAALEVASMLAVAALREVPLDGPELARLCQQVENRVVGAPCGIMDQMTSALGRSHALLELLCQPADLRGYRVLPGSLGVWGIDSGIRHAVSGTDYTSVRTGAFMGHRILAGLAGCPGSAPDETGCVTIADDPWQGYLARVDPAEFDARLVAALPLQMKGAEFLQQYGGTIDPVTRVEADRIYPVRAPTEHPVREHQRVQRFAALLEQEPGPAERTELGELMGASHRSYSACGLGSEGTDLIEALVRRAGPAAGLHGARITGGGSGGTVAVLGEGHAGPAVDAVAQEYARQTGHVPYVFRGSSPGAVDYGVVMLAPREQ